ncbi:MAG: class I SAM-dependent methyltransferase [Anaerolineaceae bacterium]|nr:class I SAM-dependent methyltransferase [Anaerolineaceae bacterium]
MDDNRKVYITKDMDDFLWQQIKELPYFRGLLRAVEARAYQDIPLAGPILDLGCGDGHFASKAFEIPLDVGIDPWIGPIKLARKQGSYKTVIRGFGDQLPFPDAYFGCVISNSVLEHIQDLDSVICEIARVIKPDAQFIFCVPNHNFLLNLSVSNSLEKIGLRKLADLYRKFFNRISRHHHCDSPEIWKNRLEKAGFTIDRQWHYFSPNATAALEWGHYFGLPSLVSHFLFRRWIIVPKRWNLSLINDYLTKFYRENPIQKEGSYSFYIAHKKKI